MKVAITGDPTSAFVFHVEGLVTDHMGLPQRLGWSAHVRPVSIWQRYFICTGHGSSRTTKLGTQAVRK